MKCGDITTEDINAVNGVFLKYLRGEEKSLTINDLHIYFEIHLSNRKGWQKKSDKGTRNVHQVTTIKSICAQIWDGRAIRSSGCFSG